MLTAIAAVSRNWGIGRQGDLLFNIPEDKKFFRKTTLGHTVIMGRKTLISLPEGKPFKNRRNIVLSRDPSFTCEGAEICRSTDEVLALIGNGDAYVAGGGEIYRQLLPYCRFAIITKVNAEAEAEVFFPDLDSSGSWKLSDISDMQEYEGIEYRFCTYENIKIKETDK